MASLDDRQLSISTISNHTFAPPPSRPVTDTVAAIPDHLIAGPKAGLVYPLTVQYCGHCTMPIEYCEYYPDYEKCKTWLEKNLPTEFDKVRLDEAEAAEAGGTDDDKKRQKRGGKGMLKAKKPKEDGPRKVTVSRAPRGKKKSVTVVSGLSTFGECVVWPHAAFNSTTTATPTHSVTQTST